MLVALAVHLTETTHADGKPERPAPCRHAVVVAVSHLCEFSLLTSSQPRVPHQAGVPKRSLKNGAFTGRGQGSASSAYVHPLCNWRSTISFLRPQPTATDRLLSKYKNSSLSCAHTQITNGIQHHHTQLLACFLLAISSFFNPASTKTHACNLHLSIYLFSFIIPYSIEYSSFGVVGGTFAHASTLNIRWSEFRGRAVKSQFVCSVYTTQQLECIPSSYPPASLFVSLLPSKLNQPLSRLGM